MKKVRYLKAQISEDILKKMAFIRGPRQAGKTTLARHIMKKRTSYYHLGSYRASILYPQKSTSYTMK